MRVGVSAIGYECKEHLAKVLGPWSLLHDLAEVFISVSHGVFPETASLGFPIYSTDGTCDKLLQLKKNGVLDNVIITDSPTLEKDLRNITLPYLFEQNIDFLVLLDLQDELYTIQELENIFKFIYSNEEYDWFKVNFKNYVFDDKTYVDDFVAPRIWRMDRNEGVGGFYYDNEIVYRNGKTQGECPNIVFPRSVCFPRHLSWVGSKEYLCRKIRFQHVHYGHCSYMWDESKNALAFDPNYYKMVNKSLPALYKD
jgi:hypothetical protein